MVAFQFHQATVPKNIAGPLASYAYSESNQRCSGRSAGCQHALSPPRLPPKGAPFFQPFPDLFHPERSKRLHILPSREPIPLRRIPVGKDLRPILWEEGLAHSVTHRHRSRRRINTETVLAVSYGLGFLLSYEGTCSHYLMSPKPLLEPKSIRDTSCTPSASKIQPREPSFNGRSFLAAAAAYA